MIISASRRTDIPAFYTPWLINRIRQGYCTVPNPLNPHQVSRVSLARPDVDLFVFWTRNPRPLIPFLKELDDRGYPYYFQFTILNYPREIDPLSPPLTTALAAFKEIADRIGPGRIIWRYDPLFFSSATNPEYHRKNFTHLATLLEGMATHCVISLADLYPKARFRLKTLESSPHGIVDPARDEINSLLKDILKISVFFGMTLATCSEPVDPDDCGIHPGKCIDPARIEREFGIPITRRKDPSQRENCGCIVSRDIGMYDSCLFGCQYCYANRNFDLAKKNYADHHPESPSLLGWHEERRSQKRVSRSEP